MTPRRTVAVYCATFLPPETHHVHRQISAVRRFPVRVFTRKRVNAEQFPFEKVTVVPAGRGRWLRRIVSRQVFKRPLLLSGGETRRLRGELDRHGCGLLHIVFGNTAVQLLPLLRNKTRRFPAVVSFHGADVRVETDKPAFRRALLEMLGRVDLVLARSQSLLEALARLGCPAAKLRLNRTGIPLDQYPYQPRAWPTDGGWRLLQACRLVEKKGVATTLRAFFEFKHRHRYATLTIAGDGPLREELEKLAREMGMGNQVRFTGFLSQEELRREMAAAHLFLHPSEQGKDGNQEGVPNSLLEAMAAGLPVFATRHGGIPEAVEDEVTGFLVPERDGPALYRSLSSRLYPTLLTKVAAAGARFVAENFALETQARKLEDCYQEAMEAGRGGAAPGG